MKEGYTLDDIIEACKTCSKDEYHRNNPRYLTPEYITRSNILAKWLADVSGASNTIELKPGDVTPEGYTVRGRKAATA